MRGAIRLLPVLGMLALALACLVRPASALDLADLANPAPQIDLQPYLAFLETDQRDVQIERPDSHTSVRSYMTLRAKGPGPRFRWVAAGFRNTASEPRQW